MPIDVLLEKSETDYLKILINLLKGGKVEVETAKVMTREFLALSPFGSVEDLKQKIKIFSDIHTFFGELYISLLQHIEDQKLSDVLGKMRSLLKQNKIEEALKVVK